ncbi:Prokaryotic phospholipase A2-like protein [Elsinoe fawcettii]|nr:Prokaryotic phospholipase A2-like protein [Elsinoe fawcettii]
MHFTKPLLLLTVTSVAIAAPAEESPKLAARSLESDTDLLLFDWKMADFVDARNHRERFPGLDFDSDGCSGPWVPEEPLDYDFEASCWRHDFGYRNYKKQNRFNDASKDKIDGNFKDDMTTWCKDNDKGILCRGVARIYYEAVQAFGKRKKA